MATTTDPTWLDYVKLGSGAASGYANAQAQSRAAAMEAALGREGLRQTGERGYNDAISAREKDRQVSAESAYKRLLQYDHINAGGTKTPMVSPYSRPIEAPGANAQRLASDTGIAEELHKRASFGDPYFPGSPGLSDTNIGRIRVPGSDNPGDVYSSLKLGDAGAGEKAAGIGSVLAPFAGKAFGWLKHLFGPGKDGKDKGQQPTTGGSSPVAAGDSNPGGPGPDNPLPPLPPQNPCPPGMTPDPSGRCMCPPGSVQDGDKCYGGGASVDTDYTIQVPGY